MNKSKKNRIIETSAKPKIKTKGAREEITVNIIYMMELFRDSMILLRKRGKLTSQITYETNVRENTFMRILLLVIGAEEEYIRTIVHTMKSNKAWWEKEVEYFVEKVFGSRKFQIVTPDDFEKELINMEKQKAEQKRLFDGGAVKIIK